MTALVSIKLCLHRRPARIPDSAILINIEVTAPHIDWNIVITITGDSSETSVLVEGISSCCVGNQGEESLCA